MNKPPIKPGNYIYGVNVVNIGDVRVARGMTRREYSSCPHNTINYDDSERRIQCEDCETEIDPFDAFIGLVKHHDAAQKAVERLQAEATEAIKANINRIACRRLQKEWAPNKGTLPACPSCFTGLVPEDFTGRIALVSKALEHIEIRQRLVC